MFIFVCLWSISMVVRRFWFGVAAPGIFAFTAFAAYAAVFSAVTLSVSIWMLVFIMTTSTNGVWLRRRTVASFSSSMMVFSLSPSFSRISWILSWFTRRMPPFSPSSMPISWSRLWIIAFFFVSPSSIHYQISIVYTYFLSGQNFILCLVLPQIKHLPDWTAKNWSHYKRNNYFCDRFEGNF